MHTIKPSQLLQCCQRRLSCPDHLLHCQCLLELHQHLQLVCLNDAARTAAAERAPSPVKGHEHSHVQPFFEQSCPEQLFHEATKHINYFTEQYDGAVFNQFSELSYRSLGAQRLSEGLRRLSSPASTECFVHAVQRSLAYLDFISGHGSPKVLTLQAVQKEQAVRVTA